jgi:hypothetical protein
MMSPSQSDEITLIGSKNMYDRSFDNNQTLMDRGVTVILMGMLMFVICEYDFVFIAYYYSENQCIDHGALIIIGWINLYEIMITMYMICCVKKIIQYSKDLITASRIDGMRGIDLANNVNPMTKMMKNLRGFYAMMILFELVPSFFLVQSVDDKCIDFWIQGDRATFIVFRLIVCILGIPVLGFLILMCLRNLRKGSERCCGYVKRKFQGKTDDPVDQDQKMFLDYEFVTKRIMVI